MSQPVRYTPAQMSNKADFGSVQSVKNQFSGANIPTFVKQFTLHYASIKRTLTQTYMIQGTQFQDTQIIAVQHNSKISDLDKTLMRIQINGDAYKIVDASLDDSTDDYIKYDFITIAKDKKGGA
ncbi:phage head closure protein [Liquorilactobacillus uvarum]|uniref:phage head closure protein n=1 Tax=Liquorilactobacillus uvarum TaxID=303240 RepID=UPI002889A725|nr:phage head closure protein [Liquorilactobacillus uvarum]